MTRTLDRPGGTKASECPATRCTPSLVVISTAGLCVGDQYRIFVGLRFARQDRVLARLGDNQNEILAAPVPALAGGTGFLRRLFIKSDVLGATERPVWRFLGSRYLC